MTLTPQGGNYTNLILATIAEGLMALGETLQEEGSVILGKLLETVASDLAVKFPITTSWTPLEQLASEAGNQLTEILTSTFAPASGQPNPVSMVYIDIYENTSIVDLAISLGTGSLVRSGPSPCILTGLARQTEGSVISGW